MVTDRKMRMLNEAEEDKVTARENREGKIRERRTERGGLGEAFRT